LSDEQFIKSFERDLNSWIKSIADKLKKNNYKKYSGKKSPEYQYNQ
jgi:hypothetical protein